VGLQPLQQRTGQMEDHGEEAALIHLLEEGPVDFVEMLLEDGVEVPDRLVQMNAKDKADGIGHGGQS